MSKKTIYIILSVTILVAGVCLVKSNFLNDSDIGDEIQNISKDKKDIEAFKKAFVLAQAQDLRAKTFALERVTSSNPYIRETAGTILGYYSDSESTEALMTLLSDKNEKVKIRAIYGLAQIKSEERQNILIELLNKNNLNDRESVHLYTALLRVSKDKSIKDSCIENLIFLMENSKDKRSQIIASSSLSQHRIPNKIIEKNFQKNIFKSDPIVVSNIIRYFSSTKNNWYKKNAHKLYLNNKLEQVKKIALIETLHLVCLKKRFDYLKVYLSSKEGNIRKAVLNQLVYHNSKAALNLFNDYVKSKPSIDEKDVLERTRTRLEDSSRKDRCLN